MFGLFKKYCEMCGKEADGRIARFGKKFCSEEHAQQYVDDQKKAQELDRQIRANNRLPRAGGGGCC